MLVVLCVLCVYEFVSVFGVVFVVWSCCWLLLFCARLVCVWCFVFVSVPFRLFVCVALKILFGQGDLQTKMRGLISQDTGLDFPRCRGPISIDTEPEYSGSFPSGSHQRRQGLQRRSKWSRLAPGVGNGTRFSVTWRPEEHHGLHKGMVFLDCTTGIAVLGVLPWDCSPGIVLLGLLSCECSTWIAFLELLSWDLTPGIALLGLLHDVTFRIQIFPTVWGLALGYFFLC